MPLPEAQALDEVRHVDRLILERDSVCALGHRNEQALQQPGGGHDIETLIEIDGEGMRRPLRMAEREAQLGALHLVGRGNRGGHLAHNNLRVDLGRSPRAPGQRRIVEQGAKLRA